MERCGLTANLRVVSSLFFKTRFGAQPFTLYSSEDLFSYERMSTRTRCFEKEAKGDVYLSQLENVGVGNYNNRNISFDTQLEPIQYTVSKRNNNNNKCSLLSSLFIYWLQEITNIIQVIWNLQH